MNHSSDILVAGGGLIGLTAALGFALRDIQVTVLEARDFDTSSTSNGRAYAINQSSRNLFENLGIWSMLDQKKLSPYQRMFVWDAQNGADIEFDCRTIAAPELGFIVEENTLRNALISKLETLSQVSLMPATAINRVHTDENILLKAGQISFHGQLLLIADGAESRLRRLLNVPVQTHPYHQHALTATIETEKPHGQTAWQVFRAEGPLALLPLPSPNQCSIVWSVPPAKAKRLQELADEPFNSELTAAFENRLGKLRLITHPRSFPLHMRHARRYAGKNWALLGDAAHSIHPLAGLGLNLGLGDVASLLQYSENKALQNIPLQAWQRQQKYQAMKHLLLIGGLKSLFGNPLLSPFRAAGLRIFNQLIPLKKFLIEQAGGKLK